MKKIIFELLRYIFVFAFVFCSAQPVFAHGGDPRIEISAERLNPGAVLEIRGVDFEFEEQLTLALTGTQVEIPLGSIIADAEGVFQLTITLPEELTDGTYIIRATTDDHVVESPQITVWGYADMQGAGQDRLDEDAGYGLLAPMPTPAIGVATAIPRAASPVKNTAGNNLPNPLIWIAAGIGIIILLSFVLRWKR